MVRDGLLVAQQDWVADYSWALWVALPLDRGLAVALPCFGVDPLSSQLLHLAALSIDLGGCCPYQDSESPVLEARRYSQDAARRAVVFEAILSWMDRLVLACHEQGWEVLGFDRPSGY